MKKLMIFIGILSWAYNTNAQCDSNLPISENFSDKTAVEFCWDFIDSDGDGHNWYVSNVSGNNGLVSESYRDDTGVLYPNNWAITQVIDLRSYSPSSSIQVNWKVKVTDWSFDKERYAIYASTSNNPSAIALSETYFTENMDGTGGNWANRSLDISSFAGNLVYVAFRHFASVFQDAIVVDDIEITAGSTGGCTDSDGDGICDSVDQCPGFDDRIDTNDNGIPDGCETSGCAENTTNFPNSPLMHSGSGSKSTTLTLPSDSQNISFTFSNLNDKLKGKQSSYYIERIVISYKDATGNTKTNGTYRGDQISSASIIIPDNAQSITIKLDDAYDGNAESGMSVSLSPVTYCSTSGPGPDPNACTESSNNFSKNPLTNPGTGSTSTTLNLPTNSQDASFSINGLDSKTKGKQGSLYIEKVDVTYVDGAGVSKSYGSYNGSNISSADINISGIVKSITVSLSNFSGTTSTTLSVNLSAVTYCISSGSSSQANARTKEVSSQQMNIIEPLETAFKIYPNPASSKLYIKSIEQNDSETNITLYNMNGMQVRSYNKSDRFSQLHELDINGLPTGLYILRISGVQGNLLKTERIVIK